MPRRRRTTDESGVLTVLMLQILLVLSEDERHGYAILQEIEERTDAAFEIGAAFRRTLRPPHRPRRRTILAGAGSKRARLVYRLLRRRPDNCDRNAYGLN